MPETILDLPRPAITGKAAHFTMYDFTGISNYTGLLNFVRSSTYHIDEMYRDGKEVTDMTVFQDATSGGRTNIDTFEWLNVSNKIAELLLPRKSRL